MQIQSTREAPTGPGDFRVGSRALREPQVGLQPASGPGSERQHLFVVHTLRYQVAGPGPPALLWGPPGLSLLTVPTTRSSLHEAGQNFQERHGWERPGWFSAQGPAR